MTLVLSCLALQQYLNRVVESSPCCPVPIFILNDHNVGAACHHGYCYHPQSNQQQDEGDSAGSCWEHAAPGTRRSQRPRSGAGQEDVFIILITNSQLLLLVLLLRRNSSSSSSCWRTARTNILASTSILLLHDCNQKTLSLLVFPSCVTEKPILVKK
jgi:hypothetical protein